MHTNVSPLGVLVFVLAGLCAAGGIGVMTLALVFRKPDLARIVARLVLGGGAAYGAVLVISAGLDRGAVLRVGEEKHFCEIDCHLAYALTGVTTAKTLGQDSAPVTAQGRFYVAAVRVRFDAETVGADRGPAPLWPIPRWIEVRDADGNRYLSSPEGLAAWEAAHGTVAGLDRPLRPGQSYVTTMVFDLPEGVREPRLLVLDPMPVSALIISHENSPFHGKTAFALTPAETATASPAP